MSFGVLFNIPAMYAESNLASASAQAQKVEAELSSGSRINSGADDPAGISMVDGMQANINALSQSVTNEEEGVSMLQTADGALSQVTSLLNRAVTLATEASNGTLTSSQNTAANQEYQSILDEIDNIGKSTTYNQQSVFGQELTSVVDILSSDSSAGSTSQIAMSFAPLSATTLGSEGGKVSLVAAHNNTSATIAYSGGTSVSLAKTDLLSAADAQTALTSINAAVGAVAAQDGYIGSQINLAQSQEAVLQTQEESTLNAQNAIQATDYAQATTELAKYQVMVQMSIAALAQENQAQQLVLKLLQ